MKLNDINHYVSKFKKENSATERYASFDFCFNLFQSGEFKKDIEKSCYGLGFYLASWGMLRGSSFLLNKSAKHYEKLILHFASLNEKYWEIDLDTPIDDYVCGVIDLYEQTREKITPSPNTTHITLVTKILLGVFGCVPAYDTFFIKTFSNIYKGQCAFSSVNKKSLQFLKEFYELNKIEINNISSNTYTLDFYSGQPSLRNYTKAKIVDMYGFSKGYHN